MRTHLRFFVTIAALVVSVGIVLGWQRHRATELRGAIAWQRAQGEERDRLKAVNESLVAAQTTAAAEIDKVLAERAAVAQLRDQLAAMQSRAREAASAPRPAPPTPSPETPPLTGNVLAHHLWKNAGQATPAAAFETVLWASASGSIDTLATLLSFDADARTEANTLFSQLPESTKREFGSPEKLIAFLTAKDVPLGSATILNQFPSPTETKVLAQIFDAEGKPKESLFSLQPDGDRWRLVVPRNAVKRYTTWLRAPSVALIENESR